MIRINLAAPRSSSKKGKGGRVPKSGGGGALGKILLVLILLGAIGGGAYYYLTAMADPFAIHEPAETRLPAPKPQTDDPAATPSSRVRTNMVENTVKEVDTEERVDLRDANKLLVPYVDMSAAEKINYEVLFGRNVLEMITRCTPPGIRFRSLEIENFQTVYATGAGVTRHMVQEMFAAFRAERGELMPKPLSHIKDDVKDGNFIFVITHRPRFGHAATDPFQAIDHLGFRESVPDHVRNFSRLAGEHGYRMSAAPSQVSVERAGQYRRITYRAAGMTTYVEFQKFVLALYDERVPVAFKKISMTPVRDEQVRVVADILFTVRE